MTRENWKRIYRQARSAWRKRNNVWATESKVFDHNGQCYGLSYGIESYGASPFGKCPTPSIYAAIIRDRSTCGRIAESLNWAKAYRSSAMRMEHSRYTNMHGAWSCVCEARETRESASAFNRLP